MKKVSKHGQRAPDQTVLSVPMTKKLVQSRVDVHSQTFSATFDARGVLVTYTTNESNVSGKGGLIN